MSTHDDAVAGAADLGLNVYGWREQDDEKDYQTINRVLDHKVDIIIDDGADMIIVLHNERTELLKHIKGACEETTTGVHRIQAMHTDGALKFPVIAVNDAYTKYIFDNRQGTCQSSFDAIMGTTHLVIAGIYFFPILFNFISTGYVLQIPTLIVISTVVIVATIIFFTGVVLHVLKRQHADNLEHHLILLNELNKEEQLD